MKSLLFDGKVDLTGTNIMFTNGNLDPWHLLSINNNNADGTVLAANYEAGIHLLIFIYYSLFIIIYHYFFSFLFLFLFCALKKGYINNYL